MTLQIVDRLNDTFDTWRQKTNRISASIGDVDAITIPIVVSREIAAGIEIGAPTNRDTWTGTGAEFTVSITEDGTAYTVAIDSGGAGYQVTDSITITGDQLEGTSPDNDLVFVVTSVSGGAIAAFGAPTGTPSKSLVNIINRLRADIGTATLTTTAQNAFAAINELESEASDITSDIVTTNSDLSDTNDALSEIDGKLGTGTLDSTAGDDIIAALNTMNTRIAAINTEIGGSVADDYTGGDETTIIAALNAIAAITNVDSLNQVYLRRSGVDPMTGTLNVDEFGITSGGNTLLLKTGASNTNRLQIDEDGYVGINKAPTSTYQLDIAGNLNATQLFYGGTDTDAKYLPATTDGSGNRVVGAPIIFDSSASLIAGNSATFSDSVTFGATLFHSSTQPFTETIQDIVGTMVSGNTESGGVAATYNDTSGKINFAFTPEAETFQDIFGGMFTGNTETGGITSTYDDAAGKVNFSINPTIVPSETTAHGIWSKTSTNTDDLTTGHFRVQNNGDLWLAATSSDSNVVAQNSFTIGGLLYFNSASKKYIARVTSTAATTINSVDIIQLGLAIVAGDIPAAGGAPTMQHTNIPAGNITFSTIKHGLVDPATNIADRSIDIDKLDIDGARNNGYILRYKTTGSVWEDLPDASTSAKGIIQLSTQDQADGGTNTTTAMTPALVLRLIDAATPDANTTTSGIIQLSTATQASTGTDTTTAMSPRRVSDRIRALAPTATTSRAGIIEIATQTEADAGSANNRAMTPALVQRRISIGTPSSNTSRRGLIQIATQTEADAGTNTTKAITPALLNRRIAAFEPVDATTTQKGVVQLASDTEILDSTVANRVVTVENAYAIVEESVGNVFKRWLFHNTDGQEVTIDNAGQSINCGADLTEFDYIEVGYNKIASPSTSTASLSNPDNRAGISIKQLRVVDIPIGRSGSANEPEGSALSKIGAVYDTNNQGTPLFGSALFYVWIDANDDNLLYFETAGGILTRLYVYHVIGITGAP